MVSAAVGWNVKRMIDVGNLSRVQVGPIFTRVWIGWVR